MTATTLCPICGSKANVLAAGLYPNGEYVSVQFNDTDRLGYRCESTERPHIFGSPVGTYGLHPSQRLKSLEEVIAN